MILRTFCRKCSDELDAELYINDCTKDEICIDIASCQTCCDDAYGEGEKDGIEKSKDGP